MRREAIEGRFRRILGPDEGTREYQHKVLDRDPEWWGECQACGKRIRGTPEEIQAHVCGDKS